MTISVYDLSLMFYEAKEIELHLTTHNIINNEKTMEHITLTDRDDTYKYKEFEVLMFKAIKKSKIAIYGYREEL